MDVCTVYSLYVCTAQPAVCMYSLDSYMCVQYSKPTYACSLDNLHLLESSQPAFVYSVAILHVCTV